MAYMHQRTGRYIYTGPMVLMCLTLLIQVKISFINPTSEMHVSISFICRQGYQ